MVERRQPGSTERGELEKMIDDGIAIIRRATTSAPLGRYYYRTKSFDFGGYSVNYILPPKYGDEEFEMGEFEITRTSPHDKTRTEELGFGMSEDNVMVEAISHRGYREEYSRGRPYIARVDEKKVDFKINIAPAELALVLDIMRSPHLYGEEIGDLMTKTFAPSYTEMKTPA